MKMKSIMWAGLAVIAGFASAEAANITNNDKKPVTIVVVENGNRMEIPLAPGASETICPSGCFLTAPNGDRIGLSGGETVEISGGAAIVK